jgi:hypothetical protein
MGGCPFYAGHTVDEVEGCPEVGDILISRLGADEYISDLVVHNLLGDALPNPVEHGGQEDHVGKAHPDNQDGKDHTCSAPPLERAQGKQKCDL